MDALNDFLAVLSSDTCRILDLFLRLIINTVFTILIARASTFPRHVVVTSSSLTSWWASASSC